MPHDLSSAQPTQIRKFSALPCFLPPQPLLEPSKVRKIAIEITIECSIIDHLIWLVVCPPL